MPKSLSHASKHIALTVQSVQRSALEDDLWTVIEPLHWKGNLWGNYAQYEESLSHFTAEQRLLYAMNWLESEVFNGGFYQFFDNPTGQVWSDAYAGFQIIGDDDTVAILDEILLWWGGIPANDWAARRTYLAQLIEADTAGSLDIFDELFADEDIELKRNQKARDWVAKHAEKFVFDGEIVL